MRACHCLRLRNNQQQETWWWLQEGEEVYVIRGIAGVLKIVILDLSRDRHAMVNANFFPQLSAHIWLGQIVTVLSGVFREVVEVSR